MSESYQNNEKQSFLSKVKKLIISTETPEETKLAWLLGIMFTCIIYIYTISRLLKDNLVVARLGGEVIPMMKGIVTISSLIFGAIFMLGISAFNRRKLFNITAGFFLTFFTIFGFVIYPFSDHFLLSDQTVSSMLNWLGGATGSFLAGSKLLKMGLAGLSFGTFFSLNNFSVKSIIKNTLIYGGIIFAVYTGLFFSSGPGLMKSLYLLVQILKYWPYALYYVFSEMVGAFFLSALFWNFANYQVHITEAKRVYPFVVLIGQIGQMGAGYVTQISAQSKNLVEIVSVSTLIAGVVVLFLHEYVFRILGREKSDTVVSKKKKPSFADSIRAMGSSPVVLFTSLIILFYGITCNILETYWKISLRELATKMFPHSKEAATAYFSQTQAQMIIWVGVVSTLSALLSGFLMRTMGWRFSALITPLTVMIGTVSFFGLDIFNQIGGSVLSLKVLQWAMIIGMTVLVFVKATKYTIFDNTKEMLLVSLPGDVKSQSKVADSLAGRWGKALGGQSLILVQLTAGTMSSLPVKMIILVFMLICALGWTGIVFKLSVLEKKAEEDDAKVNA
jgi:AAA family ATP:ADP antiporter